MRYLKRPEISTVPNLYEYGTGTGNSSGFVKYLSRRQTSEQKLVILYVAMLPKVGFLAHLIIIGIKELRLWSARHTRISIFTHHYLVIIFGRRQAGCRSAARGQDGSN